MPPSYAPSPPLILLPGQVGRNEVVVVLRVDREKGYIDLSKRRVSPEDIARHEIKYSKAKAVHSIMRHCAETLEVNLEPLYQAIAWPLARKYGHCYDAFSKAITDEDQVSPTHTPFQTEPRSPS
jgi:translation initiation factor 2 subunit 1